MAEEIWKDVLYPGRQCDRWGQWFTVTRRDTQAALHNCEKMIRRGWRIPCVWEHQPDAEPQHLSSASDRLANYARHTFGEITGAKVDPRGVLWLRHRVEDPKDVEQLRKTKFVSPKLYPSYSDSRGGQYRGATIAHVAATPTPVQFWQRPFQLSRKNAIYFSYSPEGSKMADENDGGKKGGEGGGSGELGRVLSALKELGINPGSPSNWGELCIGLEAIAANQGGGDGGGDDLDDILDDDADGTGTEVDTGMAAGGGMGGGPMLMSAKRAEPLAKMTRRDLQTRVNQLFRTGRITRPVAQKLIQEANSMQLSFTRGGELAPSKLVNRIEAYEDLPKHSAWKPKGGVELSATREIDLPEQGTNGSGGKSNAFADLIEKRNKGET